MATSFNASSHTDDGEKDVFEPAPDDGGCRRFSICADEKAAWLRNYDADDKSDGWEAIMLLSRMDCHRRLCNVLRRND